MHLAQGGAFVRDTALKFALF